MLQYALALYHSNRLAVIFLLILLCITGLLEGIGLLFLIPLLSLAGLSLGANAAAEENHVIAWLLAHHVHFGLFEVLLLFIAVISLAGFLVYAERLQSADVQQKFCQLLRGNLYRALLQANWRFLLQQKQADMAHLLTAEVSRAGFAIQQLLQITSTLILMGIYVLMALYLSWRLTLIVVGVGIVMVLSSYRWHKAQQKLGTSLHFTMQQLYQTLLGFWQGFRVTKSMGVEDKQIERFLASGLDMMAHQYAFNRLSGKTHLFSQIAGVIIFSGFFYAAIEVFHTPLTSLIVLLVLFARLLPKVTMLQRAYQQLQGTSFGFSQIQNMIAKAALYQEPVSSGAVILFKKEWVLENITVRYDDERKTPALQNFSLTLRAGQFIVVVGGSGTGKSTLADVLAGILSPNEGRILIDGHVCTEADMIAWRKQVGYVTQEAFLFSGSVRENLSFGQTDVNDAALWQALDKAQLKSLVESLPQQLETLIGDRGQQLSGGERQRLALARVLLHRPQLLILDEATSQIDPDNEKAIHQAVLALKGQLTIVMITHRLHHAQYADLVVRV